MEGPPDRRELSLGEYLILGLIAEQPTHGFALARLVASDGPVGRVYQIPRPVVYRCIGRLVEAGLVEPVGVEQGAGGPQRTVMRATTQGRRVLRSWLRRPVRHVRDLRTTLLSKLVLLDRTGADRRPLLGAQRKVLVPIVDALASQYAQAEDFDQTLVAWRYHGAEAALRFLDDLDHGSRQTG